MNKSLVMKRSIVIAGYKTSVSLEAEFWDSLKDICKQSETHVSHVVGKIDAERFNTNLSSAIRLYVLSHYKALAEAPK